MTERLVFPTIDGVGENLRLDEANSHYAQLRAAGHEPWDVLKAWLTPEEYRGYMKGTAIVYLARERLKGGDADIKKAWHHLDKFIK